MIRNYYTEAFKNGVVPVVSATQLIDGRAKVVQSIASGNHNAMAATSRVVTLTTVVSGIERNMFATAPAGGGELAWTINDAMLVESVVYTPATTIITFTTTKAIAQNTVITFFSINQSSWKQYNLFIGSSPSPFLGNEGGIAVTGIGSGDSAGQADVNLLVNLGVGKVTPDMLVYNTTQNNLLIGVVGTVNDPGDFTLNANIPVAIAANDILTFVYPAAPSVSVLTLDNQTVTISAPAAGFVLPLSVVQITGTSNGLGNLIALD